MSREPRPVELTERALYLMEQDLLESPGLSYRDTMLEMITRLRILEADLAQAQLIITYIREQVIARENDSRLEAENEKLRAAIREILAAPDERHAKYLATQALKGACPEDPADKE